MLIYTRLSNALAQGLCSTVYHVLDKRSGQELCMKVYDTEGMSDFLLHQLWQEVEIHAKLHHFSVVQFYAAWQETRRCYILLEYAPEVCRQQSIYRYAFAQSRFNKCASQTLRGRVCTLSQC